MISEYWVRLVEVASGLAVVVGIWFAGLQLVAVRRQETREFENLYVQRYWDLMDQLSADFRLRGKRRRLSDSDRSALLSHIQLCEDEVDLFELRRVSARTWRIWASGIAPMVNDPAVAALIEESPSDSFTTLKRYIRTGLLEGDAARQLRRRRRRRSACRT